MRNKDNDPKLDDYFAKAQSWDSDERARDKKMVRIAWIVAGVAIAFAAAMALANTALVLTKDIVPIPIRIDNASGAYDVAPVGELLKIGEKRNEKIIVSDVSRYVKAREGFSKAEAEDRYKTVYLMSCGNQRAEWDHYFNPQHNKRSPVVVLGNQDSDRVITEGVTFLNSLSPTDKVVQVMFDKIATRGSSAPLKYRYVATMTVQYDEKNIPENIQNFAINPFGLCITEYRRDQVGNPIPLSPPGTSDQELNQVMEKERLAAQAAMAQADAAARAVYPPQLPSTVDLSNVGVTVQPAQSNP